MSCQSCDGFAPTHKLRGPTNTWYTIGLRPACTDCGAPARLVVHRLVGGEVEKLGAGQLESVHFEIINSLDEAEIELAVGRSLKIFDPKAI